jgi:nucleoside-diphosphate-sugar epimerase
MNLFEMARPIRRWRVHPVVGFRTPPLSVIHVDDLVQLILLAVERGETLRSDPASSAGYYFACDDSEFPTYWEFGQRIAKSLDQRVFVWPLWRWVSRCAGYSVQTISRLRRQPSLLSVDKVREASVRSWASSCQKSRQQFGFSPSKSLDEHLRETFQWYIANGWL